MREERKMSKKRQSDEKNEHKTPMVFCVVIKLEVMGKQIPHPITFRDRKDMEVELAWLLRRYGLLE